MSSADICVAVSFVSHGHDVRMAGVVSTFAGSGTSGLSDGSGLAAQFTAPYRLSMAPSGTLVVGDGNRVRLVSSTGMPLSFPMYLVLLFIRVS